MSRDRLGGRGLIPPCLFKPAQLAEAQPARAATPPRYNRRATGSRFRLCANCQDTTDSQPACAVRSCRLGQALVGPGRVMPGPCQARRSRRPARARPSDCCTRPAIAARSRPRVQERGDLAGLRAGGSGELAASAYHGGAVRRSLSTCPRWLVPGPRPPAQPSSEGSNVAKYVQFETDSYNVKKSYKNID